MLQSGARLSVTVIINTISGGRTTQIVNRQISRTLPSSECQVVDDQSNKACVLLVRDALVSIAYTGIAVAHEAWLDHSLANCLAQRELKFAIAQPGSLWLGRPLHTVIEDLAVNLNGVLNADKRARVQDLRVSIIGWHLGQPMTPLAWELRRGKLQPSGNRHFTIIRHTVGKFLREQPNGLWGDALGDTGDSVKQGLRDLLKANAWSHDEVERHLRRALVTRSTETKTVSPDCIAIQLDPRRKGSEVQVTYYPANEATERCPFLTPWVLTSRIISAPTLMSSGGASISDCKKYALWGFDDKGTNLGVLTRLPIQAKQVHQSVISVKFQNRPKPC